MPVIFAERYVDELIHEIFTRNGLLADTLPAPGAMLAAPLLVQY